VDPLFGWSDVLHSAPEAFDVAGGHGECLQEPHTESIAHAICRALPPWQESEDRTAQGVRNSKVASLGLERAELN
jgi:hypothetical protein